MGDEACNLLCAMLKHRKRTRDDMIAHLARKRRVEPESLIEDILLGRAEQMSQDEFKAVAAADVPPADSEPSPASPPAP